LKKTGTVDLVQKLSVTGLPGWLFWGQFREMWSQITFAGPNIFVWLFSRIDLAPLQELGRTTLGPV